MEEAEVGSHGEAGILKEGLKEEKAEVVGMDVSVLTTSAVSTVSTQSVPEAEQSRKKGGGEQL